jgi:hypothetical protein
MRGRRTGNGGRAAAHRTGCQQALFLRSPFDFERWSVTLIHPQPNEKQVGDQGTDGLARFDVERDVMGRVLAPVKGGKTVRPAFVRDLLGTVEMQKEQASKVVSLLVRHSALADRAKLMPARPKHYVGQPPRPLSAGSLS